jgi:alginate O-acetyltransferase complex protein AlgI
MIMMKGGEAVVFSSTVFLLLFLPVTAILYYLCPRRWRNAVLLAASLFFYGWGEPRYILIMLFSTVFDYCNGLGIARCRERGKTGGAKAVLILSVAGNLAILCFFKYTDFAIANLNALLKLGIPALGLALPIGISFYTFQTMSYTIDVYRGQVAPQRNILDFAAYVTLFPQLIAGPIVQYRTVEKDLHLRRESWAEASRGLQRFVIGLGKKVLIANQVGAVWESVSAMEHPAVLTAWLGALAFTFQIYFDFSGYSDMAIGLGHLFGFTFLENFRYPYESRSVTEFWRRWHISLGTWFREYVYIPLGGNRKGVARQILNLAIVWFLTGLWHGASWNFVLWGVYYLVLLLLERFVLKDALLKIPAWIRHIGSLILIAVGWVIFAYDGMPIADKQLVLYTPDFAALGKHLLALIGLSGTNGLHFLPFADKSFLLIAKRYTVLPVLFMVCCLPLKDWFGRFFAKNERRAFWGELLGALVLTALFVVSVIFLIRQSSVPNIYYNF